MHGKPWDEDLEQAKQKAEEALKESEERFRSFFEQSQVGMVFYDEEAHVVVRRLSGIIYYTNGSSAGN